MCCWMRSAELPWPTANWPAPMLARSGGNSSRSAPWCCTTPGACGCCCPAPVHTRRCFFPQPRVCGLEKLASAYSTHDPALDESRPELLSPQIRPVDLITLQNDQDIVAHNPNTASNDPAPARSELSSTATAHIWSAPRLHIWSAPRLQRVNFRDVQDWVSCKHISGLSLGALVSRALMGSAHTRLIKSAVSKTIAPYRLLACRSDLSCHHFYFTPRNRWRLLPPKKTLRIPPGQSWPEACLRSWQTCSPGVQSGHPLGP